MRAQKSIFHEFDAGVAEMFEEMNTTRSMTISADVREAYEAVVIESAERMLLSLDSPCSPCKVGQSSECFTCTVINPHGSHGPL